MFSTGDEHHHAGAPTRFTTGFVRRTFASLDSRNYRLYFFGDLVSHIGGWMQTMAEAWLVETITRNGIAVGATFAFRFLPVLLFGFWGGTIADRFDRRRLLLFTTAASGALAIVLWAIVYADVVQLWMVYALASALGLVVVIDEPARHAFVEEMVGPDRITNAVALNGAVGNSARITGPAIAGLLIASVGVAWVFFANAISFAAVIVALLAMRTHDLDRPKTRDERPRVRDGLAYAWSITDIRSTLVLVCVVGTLVYNFPTTLTLMAKNTFGGDAGLAGFLMAILGVGTVAGALIAAHRGRTSRTNVLVAGALLGSGMLVAAAVSNRILFEVTLVPVGALAVYFGANAISHLQVSSAPELRGRVMSIYTVLTLGTTVVGGPTIGYVCERWSPRMGIGVAGIATLGISAALSMRTLLRERRARLVEPH